MRRFIFLIAIIFFSFLAASCSRMVVTRPIPAGELAQTEHYRPNVNRVIWKATQLSKEHLGYRFGSDNPRNGAMDCSGVIYYLFKCLHPRAYVPRDSYEMYFWLLHAGVLHHVNDENFNSYQFNDLKPGDLLFPLKVISEKVAVRAGVNPEISVVRRADDLIDQSKKDPTAAEKAAEEYKKTLEQTKQDAQKSGNTKEFKQTLKAQELKFTEAQKEDHGSTELKKAIEETQKVNGEVKGEKDTKNHNSQDHGNSYDHGKNGGGHSSGNFHGGD